MGTGEEEKRGIREATDLFLSCHLLASVSILRLIIVFTIYGLERV